jgi:CheY-like chemotaxis protein
LSLLRVLVVDDDADSAEMLATAVRLAGCEARSATDARSALELADGFAPEVAFLDLAMPDVDGLTLGVRLREKAAARPLVLVALTGYTDEETRARVRQAGFAQHLSKPIDINQVVALLAELSGNISR